MPKLEFSSEWKDPLSNLPPGLRDIFKKIDRGFPTHLSPAEKEQLNRFWAEVQGAVLPYHFIVGAISIHLASRLDSGVRFSALSDLELEKLLAHPQGVKATTRGVLNEADLEDLKQLYQRRILAAERAAERVYQIMGHHEKLLNRLEFFPRYAFLRVLRESHLSKEPGDRVAQYVSDASVLFFGRGFKFHASHVAGLEVIHPWLLLQLVPPEGREQIPMTWNDFHSALFQFVNEVNHLLPKTQGEALEESMRSYLEYKRSDNAAPKYRGYEVFFVPKGETPSDLNALYDEKAYRKVIAVLPSKTVKGSFQPPFMARMSVKAVPELAQKPDVVPTLTFSMTWPFSFDLVPSRPQGRAHVLFMDSGIDTNASEQIGKMLVTAGHPFSSLDFGDNDRNPWTPSGDPKFNHGTQVVQTFINALQATAPELLASGAVDVSMWKTITASETFPSVIDVTASTGPLKVTNGYPNRIVQAFHSLVTRGEAIPKTVSISMGGEPFNRYLLDMLRKEKWTERFKSLNTLWVMAAGNDGRSGGTVEGAQAPSCFRDLAEARPSEKILCVGSVRKYESTDAKERGERFVIMDHSTISKQGMIDVYTVESFSPDPENVKGTSVAAPTVSAAAAVLNAEMNWLTPEQVREAILAASLEMSLDHYWTQVVPKVKTLAQKDAEAQELAAKRAQKSTEYSGLMEWEMVNFLNPTLWDHLKRVRRVQKALGSDASAWEFEQVWRRDEVRGLVFDPVPGIPKALAYAREKFPRPSAR